MKKIIKVVKTDITDNSYCVQIKFNKDMTLWFDVYRDSDEDEITGDWNQYIFHDNNEYDQKAKAFQDANNDEVGAYNYATALELAREELENIEDRSSKFIK